MKTELWISASIRVQRVNPSHFIFRTSKNVNVQLESYFIYYYFFFKKNHQLQNKICIIGVLLSALLVRNVIILSSQLHMIPQIVKY